MSEKHSDPRALVTIVLSQNNHHLTALFMASRYRRRALPADSLHAPGSSCSNTCAASVSWAQHRHPSAARGGQRRLYEGQEREDSPEAEPALEDVSGVQSAVHLVRRLRTNDQSVTYLFRPGGHRASEVMCIPNATPLGSGPLSSQEEGVGAVLGRSEILQ